MKNLVTKLVRVMANVKRVAKNGTNTFQHYQYVTEADILDAVRENLIKENVFVFSSVIGSHKDGDLTSVQVKNTFVDGDSGETMEVHSMGQGSDKLDKGSNKAITSASKYLFMKNFLISTGDDPEATDETGKATGPKAVKIVPADATPKKYGFSGRAKVKEDTTVETAETANDL